MRSKAADGHKSGMFYSFGVLQNQTVKFHLSLRSDEKHFTERDERRGGDFCQVARRVLGGPPPPFKPCNSLPEFRVAGRRGWGPSDREVHVSEPSVCIMLWNNEVESKDCSPGR